MREATRVALETCPDCGGLMPVPKHLPFQRCFFRHKENDSALSAHGQRGTWHSCCRVWSISLGTYGIPQKPLAVYRPGGEWHWLESGKDVHPRIWREYDPGPLCKRMDVLSEKQDVCPGRAVLALHWKTNLVEGMSHEMFPFWLVTAGRRDRVCVVDCTPFGIPSSYWPDSAAEVHREKPDRWSVYASNALHSPEVELPLMYHSHPTVDPELRGAFRHFLDAAFEPVPYSEREPMLLVCLRFGKRRWDYAEARKFVLMCKSRLKCRVVLQGIEPDWSLGSMNCRRKPGDNAAPPVVNGLETCFDGDIGDQVRLAQRATYCVVPHGAAFLWSWISGAPTLEMMPPCKERLLTDFASLPLGADVKRIITNGASWNADFDEPTAETAFEAMMEHAKESGAALG